VRQSVSQLMAVLGLALLAACGGGGSSDTTAADPNIIIVESETLVTVDNACHVRGTVLNAAPVGTFDLVLRWQAFDNGDKTIGTTRVSIDNLLPGERRAYDATGFASNDEGLVPCIKIFRFQRIQTSASRD
jgi:hypothetical protein